MNNHKQKHQESRCDICWKTFPTASFVKHKVTCQSNNEHIIVRCDECPIETKGKDNIKRHMQSHNTPSSSCAKKYDPDKKKCLIKHKSHQLWLIKCLILFWKPSVGSKNETIANLEKLCGGGGRDPSVNVYCSSRSVLNYSRANCQTSDSPWPPSPTKEIWIALYWVGWLFRLLVDQLVSRRD